MNAGPLRRVSAAVGLLCLVPIAGMLATGGLTAEEAAVRAVVVLVVVLAVGNVARRVLTAVLRRFETSRTDAGAPEDDAGWGRTDRRAHPRTPAGAASEMSGSGHP